MIFFHRKPQFTDRVWMGENLKFSDILQAIQSSLNRKIMPLCVFHFKETGLRFEQFLLDHGIRQRKLNSVDELNSRTGDAWRKHTDTILIASGLISSGHPGPKKISPAKKQFSLHLIEHYPIPHRDDRVLHFCAKRGDILKPVAYTALNEAWLVKSMGEGLPPYLRKWDLMKVWSWNTP